MMPPASAVHFLVPAMQYVEAGSVLNDATGRLLNRPVQVKLFQAKGARTCKHALEIGARSFTSVSAILKTNCDRQRPPAGRTPCSFRRGHRDQNGWPRGPSGLPPMKRLHPRQPRHQALKAPTPIEVEVNPVRVAAPGQDVAACDAPASTGSPAELSRSPGGAATPRTH
jgi:hypothetical protein